MLEGLKVKTCQTVSKCRVEYEDGRGDVRICERDDQKR